MENLDKQVTDTSGAAELKAVGRLNIQQRIAEGKLSKLSMCVGILIAVLSALLTGCDLSDSKLQSAVATSIASTQVIEAAVNTAISLTQESYTTPTVEHTPTPPSTITPVPTKPGLIFNWEFNIDGDSGGWGANDWDVGDIGTITVKDGLMIIESIGNDPMVYIRNVRLDADRIAQIEILMRVSAGKHANFHFATEEGDMNESRTFSFHIQPSEEFILYTLTAAFNPDWRGIVTELRIDPADSPAMIEINHIRMIESP